MKSDLAGLNLDNKVVVITGGAGLLGKSFAKAIERHNGIAVSADLVGPLKVDITSERSIDELIKRTAVKYGKIDALVNCAYPRNKNYGRKFEEVSFKDFCENVNSHLGGYFLASQRFAVFFKKQGFGGNIINIGSVYGVIPPRFEIYEGTDLTMPVEYAAIKSAIIHLTKYMAKYYRGSNIRFNALSPGGILDEQPNKFVKAYKQLSLNKGMLDRVDLNGALLYLLSDASGYINGQNLIVDDGFTL